MCSKGLFSEQLAHGEKSGDISGSIISTLRNLTRILIRILILLLGGHWFYSLLLSYSRIMVLELEYKAWQLLQTSQEAKESDTEFAISDLVQE